VTEEITLTLPREPRYFRIAHLVLGGLAVRLDLTFDGLDDLQLALDQLLDLDPGDGPVTVTVRVEGGTLHAAVGPFDAAVLRSQLDSSAEGITAARILDTLVDDVSFGERDGAQWVELRKAVGTAA
jgi:hypothetical protein